MSLDNVEIFRRSKLLTELPEAEWEAAFKQFFHPDVEWMIAREHPDARTLVGYQQIDEYLREWQAMLPGVRFEQDRVLGRGQSVLAIGRALGTGAGSGVDVEVPLALLFTFQNGRIVRIEEYLNPGEALEAAGLSE